MDRWWHSKESTKLFGKPYLEVHIWLDRFYHDSRFKGKHRKVLHHEEGIEKAVEKFGDEVREVVRQHIVSDLKSGGWTDSMPFPKNEQHYNELGLYEMKLLVKRRISLNALNIKKTL